MYKKGKCRCQPCRDAVAADMRQRSAKRKALTGHGYGHGRQRNPDEGKKWRTCERCGEAYFGWGERFCSLACNGRASRAVQTTDLVLWKPPKSARPRAWTGSSVSRGWTFVGGECAWCGERFVIAHQETARYCSRRCGTRAGRARARELRGRFGIAELARRAIYERDGWVCKLCGEPVDRDAHYSDARAPSLDHIVPQSWMLVPDHSPGNLQTAHRLCNALRGDRPLSGVAG